MSRADGKVWSLLGVLVAGLVAGVVWWLVGAEDRALAVVGAVVGVLALGGSVIIWLWRRRDRGSTDSTPLTAVADALAVTVQAQWESAAAERRLRHPAPVPVRWRWTDRPVTGPVNEAAGEAATMARMIPLPGVERVQPRKLLRGEVRDLFGIYAGLDSGRMFILGGPGSGKSGAAVLLVLNALTHRVGLDDANRPRVPVPVLLTAHGWNPQTQPVAEWLATRLADDYPFLLAGPSGRRTPERLVRQGHVALILDGLDEMPASARSTAVRALAEQATFRLVVLTRSRELVEAVQDGHMPGAAALELQPVDPNDAADYLTRCQTVPLPDPWAKLVAHVRTDRNSPISQALTTPLMLTLVRDTFPNPTEVDAVLLSGGFASHEQVEDTLLDRILPAAYTPRPGQKPSPCTVAQARRWLGYLATQMNQANTRDLAWWEMHRWQPTTTFPSGAEEERYLRPPQQVGRIRWKQLFDKDMLVFPLVFGLVGGLMAGGAGGLTVGLVGGLTVGLASWLFVLGASLEFAVLHPVIEPGSPLDPMTCWRRDRQSGLVLGPLLGLMFGLVGGLVFGPWSGIELGPGSGPLSGLEPVLMPVFGFVGGLTVGLHFRAFWLARLTFLQLWRSGRAPFRMLRFLEDARARDVLRTSGPVYQFRHARLQDRLATATTQSNLPEPTT